MAAADRRPKDLIKILEKQGYSVREQRRGGHLKVYREGKFITSLSSTPSDHRGRRNDIARLRRYGVRIDH